MTAVALTIAGSDPSGGAGIQADLRTFNALGVAGLSVITALTVQNSQGVQSVHPVAPDVLEAQLNAILSDTRPDAVKIGMLGTAAHVQVVAAALHRHNLASVVLDPVFASTGGVPLLDSEGRQALVTELLPLCDLVTPNTNEAELLTRLAVADADTAQQAGERLLSLGAQGVLIKGGHLPGAPTDRLMCQNGVRVDYSQERILTAHTHGTGCALSAGIAAGLAKGRELGDAIREAKRLLTLALEHPTVVGQGRGYPDLLTAVRLDGHSDFRTHADRLALLRGVYIVTDSQLMPNRSHEEIARAALAGGARVIQVRDKRLPTPLLLQTAQQLSRIVHEQDGLFLVNDRADIALASDADGVHLGPDDLGPMVARRLLGPDKLVGVSVSDWDDAYVAAPHASYFGVGAVFGSTTKGDAGAPIGVQRIREIKAAFPHIPLVAIGGINAENIARVAKSGADAAAVVSAVVSAPDMVAATQELRRRFEAVSKRP